MSILICSQRNRYESVALAVASLPRRHRLRNALTMNGSIKVIHHDELHDLISVDSQSLPR